MLRPRLIPFLLVRNGGLVKTVGFADGKYVGDPHNAVRIFNEKEVDELAVLDIDASRLKREPNYRLIEVLARECRMPLCYGGGVRNVDQIARIVSLGVEKVAVSSAAFEVPGLVEEAAAQVGSQSVVVVLDAKKRRWGSGYEVRVRNGSTKVHTDIVRSAKEMQELGAGEIVVNSIDRDGEMQGYDLALIRAVKEAVSIPVTAVGGAGSLTDLEALCGAEGLIGCGAGSVFVFKGKYRAVLINYPNRVEKDAFFGRVGY